MEQLEKEFETMLIKTCNAELICKYVDLKSEFKSALAQAHNTINSLEKSN